jgi:hypothetical protein
MVFYVKLVWCTAHTYKPRPASSRRISPCTLASTSHIVVVMMFDHRHLGITRSTWNKNKRRATTFWKVSKIMSTNETMVIKLLLLKQVTRDRSLKSYSDGQDNKWVEEIWVKLVIYSEFVKIHQKSSGTKKSNFWFLQVW